ncbi:hypothetical protein LOTGIDRAFT_176717 [Lottia gigantea]|uniref:Cation efflux protein transmembrane domain-containing protein n=1 Tax=Lottia gigantea TaxID=225164 RepID=V4AHF4_LOTGI|nr:hypothetical protein LOTGIDRAFT_176717 [Lottia gigantea]ESO94625.1 hypothetical protein LOTGIDRAFT_176717 [Lottia gigantea]
MAGVLHSEVCCCSFLSHSKFGHNHSHGNGHDHSHGNNDGHSHRNYDTGKRKHSDHQQVPLISNNELSVEIEQSEVTTRSKNINVRAAFIHVIGDIIQSIGVFIAALIIKFTDGEMYRLADPICTFIFSLLVLITTIAVLRDTLRVMLEENIVTHNNVLQNAKKLLKSEFDFYHVTIQVENYHQEVMSQCDECNEIR